MSNIFISVHLLSLHHMLQLLSYNMFEFCYFDVVSVLTDFYKAK